MRQAPLLALAVALAVAAAGGLARSAGAAPGVAPCGTTKAGYLVFANGVTCPSAKKLVASVGALRYRAPKVTLANHKGYRCVATYHRKTKKMTAGSCLKLGTVATGFGWTRGGAQVPLPPGVDAPSGATP